MRFAKVLSVAALPIFMVACSDDNSSLKINNPEGETPQDTSKVEPPPNIPDEEFKPITRDYSLVWQGEGTAENPYQIASEQDLASLGKIVVADRIDQNVVERIGTYKGEEGIDNVCDDHHEPFGKTHFIMDAA